MKILLLQSLLILLIGLTVERKKVNDIVTINKNIMEVKYDNIQKNETRNYGGPNERVLYQNGDTTII